MAEAEEKEEDHSLISEILVKDGEMETEGGGAEDEKALTAQKPLPTLVAFSTHLWPTRTSS